AANPHHQSTGHGRATGGGAGVSFTETAREPAKYGSDDHTPSPAHEGALSGVVLPGPRLRYLRDGEGRGLRVLYGKRQRIPSDADDLADSCTRGTKNLDGAPFWKRCERLPESRPGNGVPLGNSSARRPEDEQCDGVRSCIQDRTHDGHQEKGVVRSECGHPHLLMPRRPAPRLLRIRSHRVRDTHPATLRD